MTLITAEQITAQLRELAAEPKFLPQGLYSGAKPEELRARLQLQIDQLLSTLASLPPEDRTKQRVLEEFGSTLVGVGPTDSEEKEQVCAYLERIMDILGIESSDGLLNNWVYGFDVEALLQGRANEA